MTTSLFSFGEVEAKTASPRTLNDAIASVLRAKDGACYAEMEPYLMAPGVTGSKAFDQHSAVLVLLKHDKENEDRITKMMEEKPALTERVLWDNLCSVLRRTGFRLECGRLIGLLEDKSNEAEPSEPEPDKIINDAAQPDVA